MIYFTCNESKIYESFTFWNKLQEKMNLNHIHFFFLDVPVYCNLVDRINTIAKYWSHFAEDCF